jgi:hypothetical protein
VLPLLPECHDLQDNKLFVCVIIYLKPLYMEAAANVCERVCVEHYMSF